MVILNMAPKNELGARLVRILSKYFKSFVIKGGGIVERLDAY